MNVAWVGTFVPEFSRNKRLAQYLTLAGVEVRRIRVPLWPADRVGAFEKGRLSLMLKACVFLPLLFLKILLTRPPDVYLVSYPGWLDMPVVKLAASLKRRPVVFDVFISLYDTAVSDRKLVPQRSLTARVARLVDRLALRAADVVVADCPAHARFFASLGELDESTLRVLYLSADQSLFTPIEGIDEDLRLVLFYGTYVPLQGAEWIVRAAHTLGEQGHEVRFVMVGEGQERATVESLAHQLGCRNIDFRDAMDQAGLVEEMHRAAVVLGVFGDSEKADRVIPHKVFEALACGRSVLTGATSAVLEDFTGDEVATCLPGDHDALAVALESLLADPLRRRDLGRNARKAFIERYSVEPQVQRLRVALEAARR